MAKRTGDSDEESPHKKRRKLTKALEAKQPIQPIQTSKDLGLLLAFDQDAGPRARQSETHPVAFRDLLTYIQKFSPSGHSLNQLPIVRKVKIELPSVNCC